MALGQRERRRLVPKLVEAIQAIPFTEGDWKHLAYATGTDDFVLNHDRLLRSLRWGDDDYDTHVFTAVELILVRDPENVGTVLRHAKIGPWMKEHAPDIYAEFAENGATVVPAFTPGANDRETVERALKDARVLLTSSGPVSAFDRVHTGLHGYFRSACDKEGITYSKDASITDLFKLLREQHPALKNLGSRSDDARKLLKGMSTIVDTLNTLRNHASLAHPNDDLLDDEEAMLAINAAQTILHYLDPKLRGRPRPANRRTP